MKPEPAPQLRCQWCGAEWNPPGFEYCRKCGTSARPVFVPPREQKEGRRVTEYETLAEYIVCAVVLRRYSSIEDHRFLHALSQPLRRGLVSKLSFHTCIQYAGRSGMLCD